ncbi:MAG: hypothetical protein K2Z81_12555 [Cyanobacteria bacterium]|nr:hypothetical protein [Cyanobacteriota bacterium]
MLRHKAILRSTARRFLLAASATLGLFVALPSSASAANYYVSPNATGTVHDGTSWATAWTDFSGATPDQRIDWSKIKMGDRIQVDTGPAQSAPQLMVYHTPLVVQKGDCYIESSTESGHNGGIACVQPDNSTVGIDLTTYAVRNVFIQGRKWVNGTGASNAPRIVPNFLVQNVDTGIAIGPNAKAVSLWNMRVQNCSVGIKATGGITQCRNLMINDNAVNVKTITNTPPQPYIPDNLNFAYSWIFNSDLQRPGPGIVTNSTVDFNVAFNDGVLGPGLSKTLETTGPKDRIDTTRCLFLNPSISHMTSTQRPRVLSANYNIMFETPLNYQNMGHSNFSFVQTPSHYVFGCIVVGGTVDVVGNTLLGQYNKQFRTSGNTMVLSSGQEDPRFIQNAYYPNPLTLPNNASFSQLCSTIFQPGNNTPGTRYACYSVEYLLGGMPRN